MLHLLHSLADRCAHCGSLVAIGALEKDGKVPAFGVSNKRTDQKRARCQFVWLNWTNMILMSISGSERVETGDRREEGGIPLAGG